MQCLASALNESETFSSPVSARQHPYQPLNRGDILNETGNEKISHMPLPMIEPCVFIPWSVSMLMKLIYYLLTDGVKVYRKFVSNKWFNEDFVLVQ
jgi:hypothetical protein